MADKSDLFCPKADNQTLHDLFKKTPFSQKEGDVYHDNDLLEKIRDHTTQSFKEQTLYNNDYHLYFRTYPHWSVACQQVFSTEALENSCEQISDLTTFQSDLDFYRNLLYLTTLIAFVAGFCLDDSKAVKTLPVLNLLDVVFSWLIVRVLNALLDAFE